MKENIKTTILETSRQLFNEHGYASVTMRDIAKTCGISVGNLTYHYPHKTDILCTLMEEIQPHNFSSPVRSFEELYEYLKEMIVGVRKNAFFFSVSDMQRLDETCFNASKNNVDHLRNTLTETLHYFKDEGYLTDSVTDEVIRSTVSFWMLSHLSWANEDYQESIYKDTDLHEFLLQHFIVLEPYMSKKGKEAYHNTSFHS